MDSLLKHMVDMTGHRDHTMLDISVISAVQELASASQTRVLALTTVRGQAFVRSRAIIVAGSVARMEEHNDPTLPGEPLSDYPALAACIARRAISTGCWPVTIGKVATEICVPSVASCSCAFGRLTSSDAISTFLRSRPPGPADSRLAILAVVVVLPEP